MKTLAIIAGGKSPEHEVSIVSARNIYQAADITIFHLEVIGISKEGKWYHLSENSLFDESIEIGKSEKHKLLSIHPFDTKPLRYFENADKGVDADVFFPIAHGVYGEDGSLQGILEYMDKPYIGPGVLGSAIGMDKDVTKSLLHKEGIRVSPWMTFYAGDDINFKQIEETLGYPCFVKPCNMGSAVGVERADNRQKLELAIIQAFSFDCKILIEKGINGREVETAVLGNFHPKVSGVGEIVIADGYYTYENKYVNDKAQVIIPAKDLSEKSVALVTETALKAYRCLQLEGMSRVDFFYVSDNEYYLNEVNTLPGFTNISMYPKLWEESGLTFTNLINELVQCAVDRYDMRKGIRRER